MVGVNCLNYVRFARPHHNGVASIGSYNTQCCSPRTGANDSYVHELRSPTENLQALESVLGAMPQTVNILTMSPDNQTCKNEAGVHHYLVSFDVDTKKIMPDCHGAGYADGGKNRSQRHVPTGKYQKQEHPECNGNFNRCNGKQHPKRCVNALSALEPGENRKNMADNRTKPGNQLYNSGILEWRPIIKRHAGIKKISNQPHRNQPLGYISSLYHRTPFPAQHPEYVRTPEIAAAKLSEINSVKAFRHDEGRWNRADKVALYDDD